LLVELFAEILSGTFKVTETQQQQTKRFFVMFSNKVICTSEQETFLPLMSLATCHSKIESEIHFGKWHVVLN
jgi:hypothetical protein